jgi:hypothetical protein
MFLYDNIEGRNLYNLHRHHVFTCNLQEVFDTEFLVLLIVYRHSKVHMSNSNGLCDIAVKPREKYRLQETTSLVTPFRHTHRERLPQPKSRTAG